MKFTINNQEELSKRIALNTKVSSSNKLIDSFKNIKIVVKENCLEMTSFNGENCIITNFKIDNIESFSEGVEFLVDGDAFKNIVDTFINFKCPYINVFLDLDKDRLNLRYNNIKFNLKIQKNTRDFNGTPKLDTYENYKTAIFNKNALRIAILNTQKCASKDQAKPILEAVNIIVKGNVADIVTLDGYKAAYNQISCECEDDFAISLSSNGAIPIVLDILKSGYDFVEINTDGVYTMIENDDTVIFLKQVTGNIPNYKKLLNIKDDSYFLTLDKKTLESALRASKIGSSATSPIKLTVNTEDSTLTIESAGDVSAGDCIDNFEITLPVTLTCTSANNLDVYINHMFITDLLKSIYTENCILTLKSAVEPLFIENENNDKSIYLMLPVNYNRNR